jgi:hypothetical protein
MTVPTDRTAPPLACPQCGGSGRITVGPGCTVACRDCEHGRLESRLRTAEKFPGSDAWADDYLDSYAELAAEGDR